jgi:parvulin-like peptidyl-prolyl isomerase
LKNWRKVLFSTLAVLLAVAVSGCSMVRVNEKKDRDTVVAKVNGEKILKGKLLDQYQQYAASYGVSDEDKDQVKSVKASILDGLINQELVRQKAEKAGHKANDKNRAQAEKEYEQTVADYAKSLQQKAEQDKADKDKADKDKADKDGQAGKDKNTDQNVDYKKRARAEMKKSLQSMHMTKKDYIEFVAENIAIQDYLDGLTADVSVKDQEIKDYYDQQLKAQKETPSTASYYSSVPIVTQPASRRVKHILIKFSDKDMKKISELRQDNKKKEADKLRKTKLKEIKPKADEVLTKVRGGDDFEALMKKYGEDPGMKSEENKDGYTMTRDAGMQPEFLEASFQLKKGETSDLVATDNGYHIIKVYEANEDVIAPLDDEKKEQIRDALLSEKKNQEIDKKIQNWVKKADIRKYEKRL